MTLAPWRRAEPGDREAVERLLEPFGRVPGPGDLDPGSPDLQVWMTDDGSAMFSLLLVRDIGRWTAHLTSMSVLPEFQGQGLARQAYDLAELLVRRFAKATGSPIRLFGYTSAGRAASIHLLEDRGWTRLHDQGSDVWALDV